MILNAIMITSACTAVAHGHDREEKGKQLQPRQWPKQLYLYTAIYNHSAVYTASKGDLPVLVAGNPPATGPAAVLPSVLVEAPPDVLLEELSESASSIHKEFPHYKILFNFLSRRNCACTRYMLALTGITCACQHSSLGKLHPTEHINVSRHPEESQALEETAHMLLTNTCILQVISAAFIMASAFRKLW